MLAKTGFVQPSPDSYKAVTAPAGLRIDEGVATFGTLIVQNYIE